MILRKVVRAMWKRAKKMWRSQTLPRPRPIEAPPLPPRHVSSTLTRHGKDIEVRRLREDIDALSRQLHMVRAQLEIQIGDDMRRTHRADSPDSRLSTVLFSPVSNHETPTPLPTRIHCPQSQSSSRTGTMRRHSCYPIPHPTLEQQDSTPINKMSVNIPSATILVPRVKRRETFSKADKKVYRRCSLGSRASENMGTFPPPKPARTFAETLETVLARRLSQVPQDQPLSSSANKETSVSPLPDVEGEELAKIICDKFLLGQCWFTKGNDVIFVNPFSNISGQRSEKNTTIGTINESLLQIPASAFIFRGISGSGKSNLAEIACMDVARRLHVNGSVRAILTASFTALRPMTTINSRRNNLSSRMINHFEFYHRHGMVARIRLRHFLLESPSRSSRANVFAMLASEMKDSDKDRFRLTGFHLREEYSSYGNLEDFKSALTALGISVNDVFSVLSALTLLNNLCFKEVKGFVDIENIGDLEDAAHLLGLSSLSLYRTILNGSLSETTIAETQQTRDELAAAIYSRLVLLIIARANKMLDSIFEPNDSTSTFNDSGVSLGSGSVNAIFRIIDIPGYCRASNNSVTELLINTINDSMNGHSNKEASRLLQKIERTQDTGENSTLGRSSSTVAHCLGNFRVEYSLAKMHNKNCNTISKELIRLFDVRCCSFPFVNKLFANDLEQVKDSSDNFTPKAVLFPKDETTVIQSVLGLTRDLQAQIDECRTKTVFCLKSNERLEYSRITEEFITEQLAMFHPSNDDNLAISLISPTTISIPEHEVPQLPPQRSYEIREGRLHKFPQRRNIVVDHVDHASGVTLSAGEVVKAISFKGECYLVETGRGIRAKVPISFTEKSLPPTEGYNV